MIRIATTICSFALATSAAVADSHLSENAALAEASFKLCRACHVVKDDDGNVLAGAKGKSGPNLYGVIGRQAGTLEGFRFGKSLVAAGKAGLIWDEEQLVAYLRNPKEFLKEYLDDPAARSKMSFKARPDRKNDLTADEVSANFYALLLELGPEMDMDATEEAETAPDAGADTNTSTEGN